ncbi:MAG: hemolysin family protein [Rhodospirillaceae bacterium]|nr:hemolysin family protein [Rhodospirillaceae bacterium]
MLYLEILILLVLIVLNGMLAMSELAVVSSRRARLERMASGGDRGARIALQLIADPGRFLSSVQIGITLVGILAGAFGGATIAARIGRWLDTIPFIAPRGEEVGFALTVIAVTYVTLIVGELVPKRVALAKPERIAARVARPMKILAQAAGPAVWLLKVSTENVLALLGLKGVHRQPITEEELKSMIAEGTRAGVFVPEEQAMIEGVLRLTDRQVRAVMTPRTDLFWLDINDTPEAIAAKLRQTKHSRLLVCEGTVDHPIGVVHMKDLVPASLGGEKVDLRSVMMSPLIVPESMPVLRLLDRFRREGIHMAIAVDEYGMTEGILTPTDILEAIAGDLPERGEVVEPMIVGRDDGSWLVDGMMPLDEFEDKTGLRDLEAEGTFHTVGGFVLHRLGRLPREGESFVYRGTRFEVLDLDGRRIDKLAVYPVAASDG